MPTGRWDGEVQGRVARRQAIWATQVLLIAALLLDTLIHRNVVHRL